MLREVSPEDAQRTADVAQFYLLAAGQYAAPLGHPWVDIERCMLKLQEAAELGYKPAAPDAIMQTFMRSAEAWPLFPGETEPPVL